MNRTSIIYGYGFVFSCSKQDFSNFVTNHRKNISPEVFDSCKRMLQDDYEECWKYEQVLPAGEMIAHVMTAETGIQFDLCQPDAECGTPAAIIFQETYPWLLSEREKNLTQNEVESICERYRKELGIPDASDFLELEYFG